MSCAVVARAAISALGASPEDLAPRAAGEPARVAIAPDAALAAAGLHRPNAARVAGVDRPVLDPAGPDRAARLLGAALVELVSDLDATLPAWRRLRLGLALGSSSGGMTSIEELFRARAAGSAVTPALAARATYFAPVASGLAAAGLHPDVFGERVHVLAACAASTLAVGVATRWLARDAADLVIAGGYDALALLVAAGFEAIRATTPSAPRPFRTGRDGMSLGEGAGLVALVRSAGALGARAHFYVHGFGAATDAVHVTAPDRTGDGLARAAERALADAGALGSDVRLVSAHATATPFNDAMEARAVRRAAPGDPIVQPLKAQIGHTLGAAGILETIAALESLGAGLLPPAAGAGDLDPDAAVRLLARATPLDGGDLDPLVLKLSAAFGGANAALVLGRGPRATPERATRPVVLGARARVNGVEEAVAALDAAGAPLAARAKLDSLSLLACGAAARAVEQSGMTREALAGAGVVVGHGLATLDIDERYFARILARGGAHAEPRAFPATSPNVAAGHAAILFGLRGPSAAVSSGLDGGVEALAFGAELVAAGDADGVLVVAVDEVGPAGQAVLAAAFSSHAAPPIGAVAVWLHPGDPRSGQGPEAREPGDGPRDGAAGAGAGAGAGARGRTGATDVVVPLGIRPSHGGPRVGHASLAALLDRLEGITSAQ